MKFCSYFPDEKYFFIIYIVNNNLGKRVMDGRLIPVIVAQNAGSLTVDSQRAPERIRSQEPRAQASYLPMFLLSKTVSRVKLLISQVSHHEANLMYQ